jgi:hypothetical protein
MFICAESDLAGSNKILFGSDAHSFDPDEICSAGKRPEMRRL